MSPFCIQLDITIFTERICKKELAPHVDILSEGKNDIVT
jgi:hypothetical protein